MKKQLKYNEKKYNTDYWLKNKKHLLKNKRINWHKTKIDRENMITELKLNGCSICGYDKCLASLHFHHVNSKTKKFPLLKSAMIRKNSTIVDELNKCVLLCANCHGEIHDIMNKSQGEM